MSIKKIISMILALLFVVSIAFAATISPYITNYKSYESSLSVDREASLLTSDEESITILQLTDIQTYSLSDCKDAYPAVKALVDKHKPDMIVLTGDNIADDSSHFVLSAMINLFDSFEIPWALVYGNHDRKSLVSMREMSYLLEKSEYCIFKTGDLYDRYGNYYYNIKLRGEAVRSLIFMDSARTNFTEEQVEWYRDTVNKIAEENGKVLPSLVFFHIPIPETVDAHELYEKNPEIGTGVIQEEICEQDENTGFFDAVRELGSTEALIYGHDHVNNTIISYEDVLFCYGTKTGPNSYYDPEIQGGTLITVTKDGFKIEHVE